MGLWDRKLRTMGPEGGASLKGENTWLKCGPLTSKSHHVKHLLTKKISRVRKGSQSRGKVIRTCLRNLKEEEKGLPERAGHLGKKKSIRLQGKKESAIPASRGCREIANRES